MIDKLIYYSVVRRLFVFGVFILLAVAGYFCSHDMIIEAYPELTDVTVQVVTQVPGLSSEDIEQQITTPLERSLSTLPGLAHIRSSSTFALSLITLLFKEGTEEYFARERTLNGIDNATLPQGIIPSLGALTGSGGEIYRYTLESNSKNLMERSEIQRWMVIPALKQVAGVADVNNFGGFTKEYQVLLNPLKLQKYNINVNDVVTAIQLNTRNAGGGRTTRGEQNYIIRGLGQIHTLYDLGLVPVSSSQHIPIYLQELGALQIGHQEREGMVGKNHNEDTIEGIVQMLKHENPSVVLKLLHEKINELQAQLAPLDVKIIPYIDRDDLVQRTIHKVRHTVLEGILFVILILMFFLGRPSIAFVVSLAIPASLISIFILIDLTGMPANLFSLGALDFGVIVDGSIVIMEAILRQREQHPNQILSIQDTIKAAQYVAKPICFSTLIIISAYLPLFAFEHAEGKLFKPMAYTVSYALLGALLCTLTVIPGLAYIILKKPKTIFHHPILNYLKKHYESMLHYFLKTPNIAYCLGLCILMTVFVLAYTVGREFLPELDEGALWLQVDLPSGISFEKANEMSAQLRTHLLKHPEISYAVTQLGRSDAGTDPWSPSHIEVPIGLTPYSTWEHGKTKKDLIETLTKEFSKMPGFTISISQPIIDNVNDAIAGAHSPLVLRVYSQNITQARQLSQSIIKILKQIEGTSSVSIFQQPPSPQISIDIDRQKIARFGINISDISQLIQTTMGGLPITPIYVNNKIYNITARFPKHFKNNEEAIGSLTLKSNSGAMILLSQLAKIKYTMGESNISHENTKRVITIRIDLRDRDLISYFSEAQHRIEQQISFDPQKIQLEWAGQFESQQRAQKRMLIILAIVLGIMSILLFFQFQTIRHILLILAVVPMATLGGLITLHFTGQTLNVATAVGFIALFGVSVQNGIIMLANIKRSYHEKENLEQAVLHGAVERLRPVLMTATVASTGMLPAALATGVGSDVQRGLATVVVGGLLISTLLTLFILPTYYFSLEQWYEKHAHWFKRKLHEP